MERNGTKFGAALLSTIMLVSSTGCNGVEKMNEQITDVSKIYSVNAAKVVDPEVGIHGRYNNDFYATHTYFFETTMREFLNCGEDPNVIYSPVNVYIAMGMLARITGGDTQKEILSMLGETSIDDVRDNIKFLFEYLSIDDELMITSLANSIWINSNVEFKEELINELSNDYYSSVFSGEMGSEALNVMYRDWINDNTNNLLSDQVAELNLSSQTIISLVSTIYYKVQWSETFEEYNNYEGSFYLADEEINCEYMNNSSEMYFYSTDIFTAIEIPTINGGAWYFLPNEGFTTEDVLNDEGLYQILSGNYEEVTRENAMVFYHIPKYDAESKLKLINGFKNLGVTSVFGNGDFSPLTDSSDVFVSSIVHGARVITNEDGIEAAAFTEILLDGCALLEEELKIVDFDCNRPFVTVITEFNVPVFTGVINNPGM